MSDESPRTDDPAVKEDRALEDGDQGSAEEAQASQTRPVDDVKKAKARAYSKGKKEEREALLSKAGFESLDDLLGALESFKSATAEKEQAQQAEQATVESLRREVKALRGKLSDLEPRARQLETMKGHLRRRAIEEAAVAAGVRDQAIGDVAALVGERVQWSPDGESLRVMVPGEAGELVPTGSLEELMEELRKERLYLFKPSGDGGSGTQVGAKPAAPGSGTQPKQKDRHPSILEIGTGQWSPER